MRFTHTTRRLVGSLTLGALAACTSATDGSQSAQPVITRLPRALTGNEQIAATATTDFGLALFRQVNAATARDSNLTLSPISASLALGMLLTGSEGETFEQVRSTLGFGTRPAAEIADAYRTLVPLLTTVDPSVKMQFANAAWFDNATPPSTRFTQALQTAFSAKTNVASFKDAATLTAINEWAKTNTNGRIPKILNRLDPDQIALLLNATYFKGDWRTQFDKADTRPQPFFTTRSAPISVPTMRTTKGAVRLGYASDGTMIAELPYGGDAFAMDIIMPPDGKLESTIDSLTPARWRALLARLPDSLGTMTIQLPKFRLEVTRELKDALAAMGMPRPFGNAQLGPMFATPLNNLVVSTVLQRIFVDVNEEGTEAAAVTVIGIGLTSAPPAAIVDRPFLFVIRERLSGTILFMGKVIRPQAPTS